MPIVKTPPKGTIDYGGDSKPEQPLLCAENISYEKGLCLWVTNFLR